eukprot:7944110-Ditylum_brightwellii.AAC.1
MSMLIGMIMAHYNTITHGVKDQEAYNFIQAYSLKKVLKNFGSKGCQAVSKEMKQLHNHKVSHLSHMHKLNLKEKQQATESFIFLAEKRDKL